MEADYSFALLALEQLQRPNQSIYQRLLDHPALEALMRHRRMSGDKSADPRALLDHVLAQTDVAGARKVLDFWEGREAELSAAALRAMRYLPDDLSIASRLFLTVGYDIGIVAPPDSALNIAHPHFVGVPKEVGYYATHETHHAGFLTLRPWPGVDGLEDPERLKNLIRFLTQMEGMAVHAACAPRKQDGALGDDEDYAVYLRPKAARAVARRFREVWRDIDSPHKLAPAKIAEVLNIMSSGERLWYRFGALVCLALERKNLRSLTDSIRKPDIFREAARKVMDCF